MLLEEGLSLGVVGLGEGRVVPLAAVGFEDQVVLWPAEVGDEPAAVDVEGFVDVGLREPGSEDEVEHDVLELASGGCGAVGDERSESGGAAPSWVAVQDVDEVPDVRQALGLGLADRPSEALVGDGGAREVEQRAGRRGRRDAAVAGAVPGVEARRAVGAEAGVPAGRGAEDGDVGWAVARRQEGEVDGGRVVAEPGFGSVGLDGGEEVGVLGEGGVADGVDGVMPAVEVACSEAAFDLLFGEAAGVELVHVEDAVLLRRERRHPSIGSSGI